MTPIIYHHPDSDYVEKGFLRINNRGNVILHTTRGHRRVFTMDPNRYLPGLSVIPPDKWDEFYMEIFEKGESLPYMEDAL